MPALFALLADPASAVTLSVWMVVQTETAASQQLAVLLRSHVGTLSVVRATEVPSRSDGVVIAVGTDALIAVLATDVRMPVVSIFVSRQSYLSAVDRSRKPNVTAIYAETSPRSQAQLIRGIYQRRIQLGAVLGSEAAIEDAVAQAAASEGLTLETTRYVKGENIVESMSRLNSPVALLAVPDSDVYSSSSLRPFLETAYRRGQAVIGFNTAVVKAGALATTYASLDDVTRHLVELLAQIASGVVPSPAYPIYWRVLVNDNVASSMNIVVSDAVRNMRGGSR